MMMMMMMAFVREKEGWCFWNGLWFWVLHDLFWKRIWPQKETTSLLFRSDLLLVLLRLPSIFVWPPEDGDYAQTLSFRGDGKIVQQPQLSDSAWRVSDGMYLQNVPMLLNLVLSGFTPPRKMNECPFSWKNFSSNPSINFQGTFVHFRGLSIHMVQLDSKVIMPWGSVSTTSTTNNGLMGKIPRKMAKNVEKWLAMEASNESVPRIASLVWWPRAMLPWLCVVNGPNSFASFWTMWWVSGF